MSKSRIFSKAGLIRLGLVAAVIPVLIYGYPEGPDPRHTGAPGEGTCLACHTGSTLNGGPGNVRILLAGESTYAPGVKQRIQVRITDTTKSKFGFQLSARLASDTRNGQAGDFTTINNLTQTLCDDGSPKANGGTCTRFPVQFIEHTLAGFTASTSGGYTYEFDWTPPATNVGDVILYAAGLGGPAGQPTSSNANVYTTSLRLTVAAAGTISVDDGGIVNSVTFAGGQAVTQGSLVAIFGKQLAATTVAAETIPLPLGLANTSVTFNDIPAPLTFVSPGQVNVQVPWNLSNGTATVVVTSNGVKSEPRTVTLGPAGPGVYAAAGHAIAINAADPNSTRYGRIAAPVGSIAGLTTSPAKAGDLLIVYATGLGPVDSTPATGSNSLDKLRTAVTRPVVLIGGQSANVTFAGLSPQFVGVYQLNLFVPQVAPGSAVPIQIQLGGITTPATTNIAVE